MGGNISNFNQFCDVSCIHPHCEISPKIHPPFKDESPHQSRSPSSAPRWCSLCPLSIVRATLGFTWSHSMYLKLHLRHNFLFNGWVNVSTLSTDLYSPVFAVMHPAAMHLIEQISLWGPNLGQSRSMPRSQLTEFCISLVNLLWDYNVGFGRPFTSL